MLRKPTMVMVGPRKAGKSRLIACMCNSPDNSGWWAQAPDEADYTPSPLMTLTRTNHAQLVEVTDYLTNAMQPHVRNCDILCQVYDCLQPSAQLRDYHAKLTAFLREGAKKKNIEPRLFVFIGVYWHGTSAPPSKERLATINDAVECAGTFADQLRQESAIVDDEDTTTTPPPLHALHTREVLTYVVNLAISSNAHLILQDMLRVFRDSLIVDKQQQQQQSSSDNNGGFSKRGHRPNNNNTDYVSFRQMLTPGGEDHSSLPPSSEKNEFGRPEEEEEKNDGDGKQRHRLKRILARIRSCLAAFCCNKSSYDTLPDFYTVA